MASSTQTGAMFGLDARLAMMIFAIMATVAGYVAYGRITMARNAAIIGEIDAMTDALRAYQTDMGTFYLFTLDKPVDDETSIEDLSALWDKSKVKQGFRNRWSGPYISTETRHHRTYGNWTIFYAQGDRKNYCTTDSDCFIWLSLSKVPATVWDEVNAYYDEASGRSREQRGDAITSGRIQADGTANPRTLIIRTIERPI
jgi:type II secretory pathway pseudopilin PulG